MPAQASHRALFHEKKPLQKPDTEFIDGVINQPLIDSTFAQFNNHFWFDVPITIDDFTYGAMLFVAPYRFTKSQEDSCLKFVEQCKDSVASMIEELHLTQEIDELIERCRQVFQRDPLGLTHRNNALLNNSPTFDDIQLSLETQTAIRDDRELKLTRREFNLPTHFLAKPRNHSVASADRLQSLYRPQRNQLERSQRHSQKSTSKT